MRVMIVGSGGREHAVADAFARSERVTGIVVIPGNAGIAREYEVIQLSNMRDQIDYALQHRPELVFIGPENPLANGMADILREHGIAVIGPSKLAARIETSKIFAKNLMHEYGIPTAESFHASDADKAVACLERCPFPLVIKADGLAAGKGVKIVANMAEAKEALHELMAISDTGVVIEEYMKGWEASLFAFTDGTNFVTTIFSQDHKQLCDGDQGANTGGMGAYAPVPEAEIWRDAIEKKIVAPTLKALADVGSPFSGILYCGLMITRQGPKVVEFNCRLGDPEAQAVLPLLDTDFIDICEGIIHQRTDRINLRWKDESCVAVVMASSGYPGAFEKGFPIQIDDGIQSKIFFSGAVQDNDALITNSGRVLSISARAKDKAAARAAAYQDVAKIHFENQYYRKDIAMRENKTVAHNQGV